MKSEILKMSLLVSSLLRIHSSSRGVLQNGLLKTANQIKPYHMKLLLFGDFVFWFKLVAVWFVNQWMILEEKLQIVQLGPGGETLASDVLQ